MRSNILVAVILLGFVVLASGCIHQQQAEQPEQQPEPTNPVIVDSQQRQGILDIVQGEAVIEADVRNTGTAGSVRIFANILGEDDVVLARENETVHIGANETRRIQMRFEVPDGAESYRLEVEAVEQQ